MKTANAALTALINGTRKGLRCLRATGNGVSFTMSAPPSVGVSVECWITSSAFYDWANLMLFNWGTAGGWLLFNNVVGNPIFGIYGPAAAQYIVSGPAMVIGKPYHLVGTYDGATVRLYVNGVPVGTPYSVVQALFTTPSLAYIPQGMTGVMDEARIYARALSAAEVAEHYAGIFRNEALLLGRWGFDENTGSTAYDLSGNGANGTLVNGPVYVDSNPYPGSECEYNIAELVTFTLVGGGVLRYNLSDVDITSGGFLFSSTGPLIRRNKVRNTVGVEVDMLGLTISPKSTDLVNGQGWIAAVMAGALDGADVKLERAYMPSWGNAAAGTLVMFVGRVAETRPSRSLIEIDVKSHLELLNIQMPRNIWQPGCVHTTFDSGCGLVKASFKSSTSVSAGSTATVINCGLAQATGYFDLGTITFTSGPNNGVSRTVKSYTPGVITLLSALPNAPANGNTFDAYPGDDKTQATCTNKFANKANFKATPYIPVAETAL